MLILTRQVGETIRIGDNIKIQVMGKNRAQVRLGITAPTNVKVHREEVYERINQKPTPVRQKPKVELVVSNSDLVEVSNADD